MITNLTITGWARVTGASAAAPSRVRRETIAVPIPIPARAETIGAFTVAQLASVGVAASRRLIVDHAPLAALGIRPAVGDLVTVRESGGERSVRVAGVTEPVSDAPGSIRVWRLNVGDAP